MYDNMDAWRGVKNGAKWHQFPIATGKNDHKVSGLKKKKNKKNKVQIPLTLIPPPPQV